MLSVTLTIQQPHMIDLRYYTGNFRGVQELAQSDNHFYRLYS